MKCNLVLRYPAVFIPDSESGGYVVDFININCPTQGENFEDALSMAQDALRLKFDDIKSLKELPEPINPVSNHGSMITKRVSRGCIDAVTVIVETEITIDTDKF